MTGHPFNMDAYAPAEMATRVEAVGVAKANLDAATMFALAVLAGAFIALGANLTTILFTERGLSYGVSRVAGGLVFSLGLMLVIVGGAELFTGNSLIVMAWASGRVSTGRLLRNWLIVYAGNFTGALATAVGIYLSRERIASSRAQLFSEDGTNKAALEVIKPQEGGPHADSEPQHLSEASPPKGWTRGGGPADDSEG